jgi:hypothetical protein
MKIAFWYFRLAFAYMRLRYLPWCAVKEAFYAYRWDNFKDYREDGYSPMQAAIEDLSYA